MSWVADHAGIRSPDRQAIFAHVIGASEIHQLRGVGNASVGTYGKVVLLQPGVEVVTRFSIHGPAENDMDTLRRIAAVECTGQVGELLLAYAVIAHQHYVSEAVRDHARDHCFVDLRIQLRGQVHRILGSWD